MKRNRVRPRLRVTGGGRGVVNHGGARLLADLADAVGLTEGLSGAMAPTKLRRRGWDRGEVLVDLVVMIADGGEALSDLSVLQNQPDLFGEVASTATAWRALDAVDDDVLAAINKACRDARERVWAAGGDPGFYVIDIDPTLIDSHSEKELAAKTFKKTFGHYPMLAFLDATGEALAGRLRAGNAGSTTAADWVATLDDALYQLPVDPAEREVIVRADAAAHSHEFVEACQASQVRFVVGAAWTAPIAETVMALGEEAWVPAVSSDGSEELDHAEVAEITGLVDLSGWPDNTRMLVRRDDPHPGAQLSFTDVDGHRYLVCITDLADPDIAYLEALYRGRGRAERNIADAKDTGLANLPSESAGINAAWMQVALIAQMLLSWTKLIVLDGDLAHAEPKRLRHALLHVAATITTTGRRRYLRLADNWPWTNTLIAAFDRLHNLPLRI